MAHRRAVVGAVEQESLDQLGVARHEARAHARRIGALGKAGEHHQPVVAAPQLVRRLQGPERRRAAIDLGVALVCSDDEAVAIGELEELAPFIELHHPAARVGGRTGIDELHASPGIRRPIDGGSAREERRAFVYLIEGVGTHHPSLARRVEHRLGEGEQRLAGAIHRQHLFFRVRQRDGISAGKPSGNRLPQLGSSRGQRIGGQPVEGVGECIFYERRGRVLWLADLQVDRRQVRWRRIAGDECAELLERVGLEFGEERIHRAGISPVQPFLRCSATTVV